MSKEFPSTVDRSEQVQEIVWWAMGQINKKTFSAYNFIFDEISRRFPEFDALFTEQERQEIRDEIFNYYWN